MVSLSWIQQYHPALSGRVSSHLAQSVSLTSTSWVSAVSSDHGNTHSTSTMNKGRDGGMGWTRERERERERERNIEGGRWGMQDARGGGVHRLVDIRIKHWMDMGLYLVMVERWEERDREREWERERDRERIIKCRWRTRDGGMCRSVRRVKKTKQHELNTTCRWSEQLSHDDCS